MNRRVPFRRVRAAGSLLLLAALLPFSACRKSADETGTTGSTDFLALMNVGRSQYEKGDAAAAVASFQQAVAQQPTSIDARLNLANAHLAAGQPDAVLAQAAQVLDMDPRSAAAHYLAGCAHLRRGDFAEAVKSLQQAKDIDRTVNEVSFQLGIAYEGLKNHDDAIGQWRETIEFGPEHPAAYYRLSQALLRKGETDEAETLLERHREVTAGRNIPSDPSFFEQCAHTRMRVPFVLEQPDPAGIAVQFTDASANWLAGGTYSGPVGLVDFQRNGQPGLLVIEGGREFRLLTFTNGQFVPVGNPVPADPDGGYTKVLVGDLDSDRYDDVLVLGTNRSHLLKISAGGRMADRTLLTGLAQLKAIDGALADLDFTSKLSLVAALPDGQGVRFYRSLGNASFKEDAAALGLPTNAFAATQVTVADWNKDDLPDVIAVADEQVRFFANLRGGRFAETNAPVQFAGARHLWIGDLNNDFRPDAAALNTGSVQIAYAGDTSVITIPLAGAAPGKLTALDYDNDGWLDLVAHGGASVRAWRNLGTTGWRDSTADVGLPPAIPGEMPFAADLDHDCDFELAILAADGALRLFRNDGGNQNHMIKFKAVGNRSNSSGIGARLEMTAGNWRGMRTVERSPLEVGIGRHTQIDSMFVQWTQLRMHLETIPADECRVSVISEIEQKQMTSCPYLYAWDGRTFRFVSDFLAAAPVGLPVAPGRIIAADPEELLWIGDADIFPPRDGRHVVQLTEELSEVLYLDEVKLVAVDHPAGTLVFPTSKMLPGPPWPRHELVAVQKRVPLRQAFSSTPQPDPSGDREGGSRPAPVEVTDRLQAIDHVRVSPEIYGDHLRGWAKTQEIILDFGPLDHTRPLVLALNGWLRFGGAMANMAAAQRADLPFPFPTLQAGFADGSWLPVDVQVGTPAGRTKSIVVDLAGKLPAGAQRLKLVHAFELHWDEIALFEKSLDTPLRVTRLSPAHTDLHYRGFSHDADLDWTHPTTPVYDQLQMFPLIPKVPAGWTTRFGPVDDLVATKDNAFAIINGGEELTVEFDANALPPVPAGHERQFFLWSVGWDKDTDYHTVLGDRIEPLPWHGMDDQAYGRQPRPAFESDELMRRHTTRWVGPHVPHRLESATR